MVKESLYLTFSFIFLFKKLKIKFVIVILKKVRFFVSVALFIILATNFLYYIPVFAQGDDPVAYKFEDIRTTVETKIDGKNNNLIRILKNNSNSATLTVAISVQFSGGTDITAQTIKVGGGDKADKLDTGAKYFAKRPIIGMGIQLFPIDRSNICKKSSLAAGKPVIGDNLTFYECNLFYGGQNNIRKYSAEIQEGTNSKNVVIGKTYESTFVLDDEVSRILKLDFTDTQNTQKFTVAPWIQFGVIDVIPDFRGGSIANLVDTSRGKDLYVKVYEDQVALDEAIRTNNREGVPGYGSNSGNFSLKNTGNGLLGFFNQIVGIIIGFIGQLVYGLFFLLVAPLIEGILHIRTYTDSFAEVIYPGWEVIRNLSNIFFIVALIAIGLGTLFRLENYQFKHLLVQLMIAALMVNFSLVLGQAVLGIADTMQNQFLPDSRDVVRDLGKELMVSYSPSVVYKLDYEANGYFANTIAPLFYLALSIGSFLVFAAVAAYLLIRIVALWVLLMISPLAYVAGILPTTAHYRTEWWSTFLKYAFFTPIMAFFLNMAAIMVNTYKNNTILQKVLDNPQEILGVNSDVGAFFFKVSSNILILVFLIIALKVAEQAGIYGASTITNIAQKGIAAPFALAGKGIKAGASFGAEKFFEKTGVEIKPSKWIEGYKESREINKKRREDLGMQRAEGRHTLGNPTAFFQRYWSPSTLIGKKIMQNKKGKILLNKAKAEDEKAEKVGERIEELKKEMVSAPQEKRKTIENQIKALDNQKQVHLKLARRYEYDGKASLMPPDYYTQSKTRQSVNEEKNKIHAETWEELVDLAVGAEKEDNVTRYLAIMQKLAETSNENELLTHTEYIEDMPAEESSDRKAHRKGDTFDQTAEGLENFRRQIMVKKFGLSQQASMRSMADITDIAESHNHWGIARAYGSKYGKLFFKPEEERDAEARAEKAKIDEGTKNGRFNRLGDFDELVDVDYLSTGVRFDLIQNNGLLDLVQGHQNVRFRLSRGSLNNSKLKATSFGANLAIMEKYRDEIDPTLMSKKRDARGGQVYYQEDTIDDDGARHKKGEEMMISVKEDLTKTIEELRLAGREQWGKNEEYNHQQALIRRVNADTLPERHKKSLIKAGYLKQSGTKEVNGRQVPQYKIDEKWVLKRKFDRSTDDIIPNSTSISND